VVMRYEHTLRWDGRGRTLIVREWTDNSDPATLHLHGVCVCV